MSFFRTDQPPAPTPPRTEVWGTTLEVPERSQVAYLDGRAWCSPTSVSMILAWWAKVLNRPDLDQDVPQVARAVHDPGWGGTGNWPFNTALAGSLPGLRGAALRLPWMPMTCPLVDTPGNLPSGLASSPTTVIIKPDHGNGGAFQGQ